jgi:hypothetical protein
LEVEQADTSDLLQALALELADGRELTPAGLDLEGQGTGESTEHGAHLGRIKGLTVKFWLEPKDFAGPMDLRIGNGNLTVRTGSGLPQIPADQTLTHRDCDW